MEYILKKDDAGWLLYNLENDTYEVGELEVLLDPDKYYEVKEEELK